MRLFATTVDDDILAIGGCLALRIKKTGTLGSGAPLRCRGENGTALRSEGGGFSGDRQSSNAAARA